MRVTSRYGVEVVEAARASERDAARPDERPTDDDWAMVGQRVGEEWARRAGSDLNFDRRRQTAR
jgi:hypothetical protein